MIVFMDFALRLILFSFFFLFFFIFLIGDKVKGSEW